MGGFEKFKKELPFKEKLYSFFTCKRISDTKYEHILNPMGGNFQKASPSLKSVTDILHGSNLAQLYLT